MKSVIAYKLLNKSLLLILLSVIVDINPIYSRQFAYFAKNEIIDSFIKEGRLSNGIRYIIIKNNIPAGKADFYAFYNVGAIQEEPKEYGLAHLYEHVGFAENNSFLRSLWASGLKLGQDINAHTGLESTQFEVKNVLSENYNLCDSALFYLYRIATNFDFSPSIIAGQKKIILEEWRQNSESCSKLSCRTKQIAFKGSRYDRPNIVGDSATINHFGKKDLMLFCHKWYRTDNLTIIAIGEFDPNIIENKIKTIFGAIKKEKIHSTRTTYPIPNSPTSIINITSDRNVFSNRIEIQYRRDNESTDPQKQLKDKYIDRIIDYLFKKRLTEITYITDAPYYNAEVFCNQTYFDAILYNGFTINADTYNGIKPALKSILIECERIKRYGFTSEELSQAKQYITEQGNLNQGGFKLPNDEYFIKSFYYILDGTIPFSYNTLHSFEKDSLTYFTQVEVNRKVNCYLNKYQPIIALRYKQATTSFLPTSFEFRNLIDSIKTAHIPQYVLREPKTSLMDSLSTAGKIVKASENKVLGVTEWELSNGVKVILKPTLSKEDEIMLTVIRNNCDLNLKKEYVSTLRNARNPLVDMGVNDFSSPELTEFLRRKKTLVYPVVAENEQKIEGYSSSKDFETALQLIHLYFSKPRFDSNALQRDLSRTTGSANFILKDTIDKLTVCSDSINLLVRDKKIVTIDKMKKVYQLIFGDPKDFTFFFAGNIKKNEIKELIERYIGSLQPATNLSGSNELVDYQNKDVEVKWWKIGQKSCRFNAPLDMPSSSVYICCQGALKNSSLTTVYRGIIQDLLTEQCSSIIRDREKASYSIRPFWASYSDFDTSLQFSVFFKTDPAQAEKMKDIALIEMKNIFEGNISEDKFNSIKTRYLNNRIKDSGSNGWWVNTALPEYYIRHKNVLPTYIDEVKNIDIIQVKEIMKQVYYQGNIVDVVMHPMGKY